MTDSILTIGELDALRSAVETDVPADDKLLATPAADGAGEVHEGSPGFVMDGAHLPRYRFGEGRVFGDQREERLSWVFDRAARALETRLSDVLETSVSCAVTFMKVTRFAEFRETFEVDVRELAMLSFAVAGQPGQGLLALEPEVVENLVEGLMGGAGAGLNGKSNSRMFRPVTALDVRVSRRVLEGFLDDLGEAWNPSEPLQLGVTGVDTSGVVARSWDDSVPVVAALLEVSVGKRLLGMVGLVVPRGAVDTVADPGSVSEAAGAERTDQGPILGELPEFSVDVQVQLGSKRMSVRELLALTEGDVVFLEGRPAAVGIVQGVPKFEGTPGRKNGNKAIRIAAVSGRSENVL
jgi:flagellar motor switch protein FliM